MFNEIRMDKRLDNVRAIVQEMIKSMDSALGKQDAVIQLFGVSGFASMLALRRGHDQTLAAVAGLVHNYYFCKTGIPDYPGPNSAEAARPFLRDLRIFTETERITILRAVFHQGETDMIHGPYEEIIKDAIVLHGYFQNASASKSLTQQGVTRLQQVLMELAIPATIEDAAINSISESNGAKNDKRSLFADIAEELAGTHIAGLPGDRQYLAICRNWPDADIHKAIHSSWCAAFVYHCFREAGFRMPIRYPNGIYRFAGVGAWLEWAQLPETGFFFLDGQQGFSPQRGDIVIYEKLLSDEAHDHIGIVLGCEDKKIVVAEGNRDNLNYSCNFERDRWSCIRGYIRIANDYEYEFSGIYTPNL